MYSLYIIKLFKMSSNIYTFTVTSQKNLSIDFNKVYDVIKKMHPDFDNNSIPDFFMDNVDLILTELYGDEYEYNSNENEGVVCDIVDDFYVWMEAR